MSTVIKYVVPGWDSQISERGETVCTEAGAPRAQTSKDAGLCLRLRQWRERRRAYDELMALDDRLLQDIGISRSEIRAAIVGRRG